MSHVLYSMHTMGNSTTPTTTHIQGWVILKGGAEDVPSTQAKVQSVALASLRLYAK